MSRHALKHIHYEQPRNPGATHPPGQRTPGQSLGPDLIAARAYELWRLRGSPEGSPEVDWLQAERELSSRTPVR